MSAKTGAEQKAGTMLAPEPAPQSPGETHLEHIETDENTHKSAIKSEKPRRVKVYLLDGDDWLDNGTGYCMGEVDSATQKPYFIVRNELDTKDVILQSYLEGSIQYQRQQETLIVWTDLSGKDLALSFQENDGCADLCEFIVRVQQENLSPSISLYYVLTVMQNGSSAPDSPREITELITGPITYPPEIPSRDSLQGTLELLTQSCNSMYSRFKVSSFLVETHYFDKLFELFGLLEKDHDLEGLHLLNDMAKVALYYNEPKIVEELVSYEERVLGLVGILEYDRDFPDFKACHREYLTDESRLKTVVDIPLPTRGPGEQMDIFRKDFVLQYLKNVVLPRSSDESTLNLLSTMIHENHIEIIDFLKDPCASSNFLQRIFDLYEPASDSSIDAKRDGAKLLHQYVLIAKGNSSSQSADFFSALVKYGLLKMIKFALDDDDSSLRVIGIEILTTVIDQDVTLVSLVSNEHKEVDELEGIDSFKNEAKIPGDEQTHEKAESIKMNLMKDMSLTLTLAKLLLHDGNPALKIQTYEAVKTLLSSTVFDANLSDKDDGNEDHRHKEHEAYVKKYFVAFYEQVAPTLFSAFIDLASGSKGVTLAAEKQLQKDPVLFQHLCDLISFCCQEHESSICRPFLIKSNALDGIAKILTLNANVTLKLGVLRCLKSLILLDDYSFCCYMINNDLFEPFFTYFDTVADENSLPNSSCLDLLEVIIKRSSIENFGCLAVHIGHRYKPFLETKISYVSTGSDLLSAAKRFKDRVKDSTVTSVDVDQDYLHDPHPSSPISREGNGYHPMVSEPDINGNSRVPNDEREDPGQEDSLSKRKMESSESIAEKRSCNEREKIAATCQEANGIDDGGSRGMAILP